jgi:hypothetical protein
MDTIRLAAYNDVLALSKSYNATTRLEAACFEKSVRAGHLHQIPVWQYSTGTILFETDKLEVHVQGGCVGAGCGGLCGSGYHE